MTDQTNDDTAPQAPNELTLLKDRARMMNIKFSNNISLEKLKEKVNAKMEGETVSDDDTDNDGIPDQDDPQVDANGDGHDDRNGEFVDGNQAAAANPIPQAPPVAAAPATPASQASPPPPLQDPAVVAAPTAAATLSEPSPQAPARKLTRAEQLQKIRQDLHTNEMRLVRVRIANMDPKKADLPGEILTVANEYLGTVRKYIPYGEATENGYHVPKCLFDQMEERKFLSIRTVKDKRTGISRPETKWMKEFSLEVLPPLTQEELNRLATAQVAAGSMDDYA